MAQASADQQGEAVAKTKSAGLMRWVPLAALVAVAVAAFYQFGHYLSFEALSEHRDALLAWRDSNFFLAALSFVGVYAAVVALSIPGALWMMLAGGFLFGLWPGALMIIFAATLGATIVLLIARGSLGAAFRERAGPWLGKIERGFKEDQESYLLIMRLTPVVPFFIANVAPALIGVRARTFIWTTFVGIAPGTAVYTWVGSGLGAALEAGTAAGDITGAIFRPEVLGPILGLAALSALPIFLKKRRAAEGGDAEGGREG